MVLRESTGEVADNQRSVGWVGLDWIGIALPLADQLQGNEGGLRRATKINKVDSQVLPRLPMELRMGLLKNIQCG